MGKMNWFDQKPNGQDSKEFFFITLKFSYKKLTGFFMKNSD